MKSIQKLSSQFSQLKNVTYLGQCRLSRLQNISHGTFHIYLCLFFWISVQNPYSGVTFSLISSMIWYRFPFIGDFSFRKSQNHKPNVGYTGTDKFGLLLFCQKPDKTRRIGRQVHCHDEAASHTTSPQLRPFSYCFPQTAKKLEVTSFLIVWLVEAWCLKKEAYHGLDYMHLLQVWNLGSFHCKDWAFVLESTVEPWLIWL